ncbi:MAG: hypothetical protein JWM80_6612 [Cyanobacteria bacterium RYN_339]|nr:hypothetical protein [Cyanobacteria bacterium RYN_339]
MASTRGTERPSDATLHAQLAAASARADGDEPLAVAAGFDRAPRRVVVDLDSGATFMFPVDRCQGLAGQPDDLLANVVVMPGGDGLGWPALDVHYHVGSLVVGTLGGRAWMKQLRQALAQDAGKTTSTAKAAAARANGKKGGRPKMSNKTDG